MSDGFYFLKQLFSFDALPTAGFLLQRPELRFYSSYYFMKGVRHGGNFACLLHAVYYTPRIRSKFHVIFNLKTEDHFSNCEP
jgi:hypothetical protein